MSKSAPVPPPRPAELQAGVSLIVAVLGISFFLLIVIGVSLSLSVNSRQTVVNQGQVLSAQYAAENAATQAQMRLNVAQGLMSALRVPNSVAPERARTMVESLCGASVGSYIPGRNDPNSMLLDEAGSPLGSVLCTFPGSSIAGDEKLFSDPLNYADQAAYHLTGTRSRSRLTEQNLRTFWAGTFGRNTYARDGALATFGIIPHQVVRYGQNAYAFVFEADGISASAERDGASRRLVADGRNERYVLLLSMDSFAKCALCTDVHRAARAETARIVFTEDTNFSGPVRTNGVFTFSSVSGTTRNPQGATFSGATVRSAGCDVTTSAGGESCQQALTPGALLGKIGERQQLSADQRDPTGAWANTRNLVMDRNTRAGDSSAKATFERGFDMRSDYLPFPSNARDQRVAANNLNAGQTGISFAQDADEVQLAALAVNGREMQHINTLLGAQRRHHLIDEEGFVFIPVPSGATPPPVQTFSAGGVTWGLATKRVSGGEWVLANATDVATVTVQRFNGVIHAERDVRWLGGPTRTNYDDSRTVRPAIASFMQMNISVGRDVNIYRDLTYADDPRTNPNAKNVLGVFSSGTYRNSSGQERRVDGFINIMADTGGGFANRRVCNNESCTSFSSETYNNNFVDPNRSRSTDHTPPNLQMHGSYLASYGSVRVNGFSRVPLSVGNVSLLGGIISQYYGAFGQAGSSGYGRDFVYDTRFDRDLTPPEFPTQGGFSTDVAAVTETNELTFNQLGYWRQVGR